MHCTMETPAEQSKGNDRMNTSESVESAGEEMAEEAKHSNEIGKHGSWCCGSSERTVGHSKRFVL